MGLPSNASKANSDQSSDDPKLSILTDLAGVIDTVNSILAHLGGSAITAGHAGQSYALQIGQGLQEDGNNPAGLTLKLVSGGAVKVSAGGVEVDINGLTEDTSPDLNNDFVPTYDASAAVLKKVKAFRVGGGAVNLQSLFVTGAMPANFYPSSAGTDGVSSWVCPAGVTKASVLLVGGGGGCAGDTPGVGVTGGPGGNGVVTWKHNISVTPGQTYTLTGGKYGVGGFDNGYPSGTGADGGDSTFSIGGTTLARAKAGVGGQFNTVSGTNGSISSSIGDFMEAYLSRLIASGLAAGNPFGYGGQTPGNSSGRRACGLPGMALLQYVG